MCRGPGNINLEKTTRLFGTRKVAYIVGTDEVAIAHQDIGHAYAKDDCKNPSTHKAFDCLLWGDFDKLSTPKSNTAYVSKDVVSYNEGCWQEEPYHALEDIIHDEMGLDDNEV